MQMIVAKLIEEWQHVSNQQLPVVMPSRRKNVRGQYILVGMPLDYVRGVLADGPRVVIYVDEEV